MSLHCFAGFKDNFFGIFVDGVVKTASYIFIGISWVKTYFLDKLCLSIIFPGIEQNLLGRFSAEISKLTATWPEENFDEKNFELFFSFSDIERNFFVQSSENLCQGCQHCILLVPRDSFGACFFEKFVFSLSFSESRRKISNLCPKWADVVVWTAFKNP